MESPPRIVASRQVFEGRVFRVRTDELQYDDGKTHHVDVVEHGASLGILPVTRDGEIVLVRQYRHPAASSLWEIPAGTAEPGEGIAEAARRELREETGYTAGRLSKIGSFWTTPGFCSEVMHLFHAEELVEGPPAFDEDERIEIGRFALQAAWRLAGEGVADAKTVIALYWLQGSRGEIGSDVSR